jgi:small-conductance mechanosensitive channel
MESALRPVFVVGTALVITLAAGWAAGRALRRLAVRQPRNPLWPLLRRCRPSLLVVLCTALLRGSYRVTWLGRGYWTAIGQILTLVLIGACAWLAVRVCTAVAQSSYSRYASNSRNPARLRRVRTQVTLIQRVVTAIVTVIAVASMLMTFPAMRAAGASLLASAGVLGVVAGIAAQSLLGNLFAGMQIAFGDMVRIGDTVVIDGEWGTVEEITLTYLVVRTWDERRITMPVSYFTSKPFENWSRDDPRMTGTVFFHLDHTAPVALMRDRLHEVLTATAVWDRRGWGLEVTDTTASTIEVRALVTAADSSDVWTLRCLVRERLVDWLNHEHPYALPRINTAPAPKALAPNDIPRPSRAPAHAPVGDQPIGAPDAASRPRAARSR